MISMLAWPCGGKPAPGATRSSLITRSGPQPIQDGSWYWPKENVWWLSSQPALTWPRSAEVRRTCMGMSSSGWRKRHRRAVAGAAALATGGAALLGRGGLGGDAQLHFVADVGHVGGHAEVAALDGGGGIEADRIALGHRVRASLVE